MLIDVAGAATDINIAQYVSLLNFSFPLRILQKMIFSKKLKRNFRLINGNSLCEFGLACTVSIWIWRYINNQDPSTLSGSLDLSNTYVSGDQVFVLNTMEDILDGVFRFDFLLAFHAGLIWLKVMFTLKLTRLFGPLIKIIENMMKVLIEFCVVWGLNLVFFTSVGMLLFTEVPAYDTFQGTMIMFIASSLGKWNLSIYNDLLIGPLFGEVFHLIFIVLNKILFLNLIIAILSKVFSILEE